MGERFIAFDVETPNFLNHRMSAIGAAVVEEGEIREEFYSLVNPETWFDRFNIDLTGITPEQAEKAPAFPALWEKLEPLMSSGILIAHNAPFDMSVLAKCLRDYGILWRKEVVYACTCRMARRLLPELPDHRLNTVSDYLEIRLNHHHAGSDSRACGEILTRFLRDGPDRVEPFLRYYDLGSVRTVQGRRPKLRRETGYR